MATVGGFSAPLLVSVSEADYGGQYTTLHSFHVAAGRWRGSSWWRRCVASQFLYSFQLMTISKAAYQGQYRTLHHDSCCRWQVEVKLLVATLCRPQFLYMFPIGDCFQRR